MFTIPVIMMILVKYNLNVENTANDDPVDIVLSDKGLCGVVCGYDVCDILCELLN